MTRLFLRRTHVQELDSAVLISTGRRENGEPRADFSRLSGRHRFQQDGDSVANIREASGSLSCDLAKTSFFNRLAKDPLVGLRGTSVN